MDASSAAAFAAFGGAVVAGAVALTLRGLDSRKQQAEIHKLSAEGKKFEAEASEILGERLLSELTRIEVINARQLKLLQQQEAELGNLRTEIMRFNLKEVSYTNTIRLLRQQVLDFGGEPLDPFSLSGSLGYGEPTDANPQN